MQNQWNIFKLTKLEVAALESLEISEPQQLIAYYPYRYQEVRATDLSDLAVDQPVILEGVVVSAVRHFRLKGVERSTFEFHSDNLEFMCTIFNRPWITNLTGKTIVIFGTFQGNNRILVSNYNTRSLSSQLGIHPVYHLNATVTQGQFQKIVHKVLDKLMIDNLIPGYLMERYSYPDRHQAINELHQPTSFQSLKAASECLKYEEVLLFQMFLLYQKFRLKHFCLPKLFDNQIIESFIEHLPFKLSFDQQQAINEILADLRSDRNMIRLLQGDVGSGKTIVAVVAMLASCLAGQQSVLLAPTELLARQHYLNIKELLGDYCHVELLVGNMDRVLQNTIINQLKDGKCQVVIGSHRVLQADIQFNNLGLVIADEQQRFGVKQRQALIDKGERVDFLQMSATPIPRTAALTLYADVDVSVILSNFNEQRKINTKYFNTNAFFTIKEEIEALLSQGNQCYVVCATINSSPLTTRSALEVYQSLSSHYAGQYVVGLIHGQLDEEQQVAMMDAFKQGEIHLLVCTSIVEVGIDVAAANVMIIYDAHRFGMSQLHQLRGRVGRHIKEGHCYLLSSSSDEMAINRLKFIESHSNGFEIALYDMQQRGFGDILGIKQSGKLGFNLINFNDDQELIKKAYDDAKYMIDNQLIDERLLDLCQKRYHFDS